MAMNPPPNTILKPANVLVVEDDELVRAVVRKALTTVGHHLWEAVNLAEARQRLAEASIDLIMLDIVLGRNEYGIELLHEVAPRVPDIAVVMMTGLQSMQTAIDCLRDGAFDYLVKPFALEDLRAVVTRARLRQWRMITERHKVEEQLRILGRFPAENPYPVLRVSSDGTILYANDASESLLKEWACPVGKPVPPFLRQWIADASAAARRRDIEVAAAQRVFSFSVTPIKESQFCYLYGHDITRLKETERELVRLKDQAQERAVHDPLTGLPNRTLLEERLQQAIVRADRFRHKVAVVYVDLDNFKQVNDTQGHQAGDEVLVAVATHLRQAAQPADTVARWGGDEIILLLPELARAEEALRRCEKIKAFVQQRLVQDRRAMGVTMSMGIALYPDDANEPAGLLQGADAALYLAKSRGRDGVVVFGNTPELSTFRQRGSLRSWLGKALDEGSIALHYQPIVEAATGRVVAVEALARWHHETLGWVSPDTFIPLAEATALIAPLGRQVLVKALEQWSQWARQGFAPELSVNLAPAQLLEANLAEDLRRLTEQHGLRPEQLTLELTERQALLGLSAETRCLEAMAGLGFNLAIDDFGQGYSSLAVLHDLPVREVKVDRQFVRHLGTDKGRRLVEALVDLARHLRLRLVAEGVETPEQAAALRALGMARLQGYWFAPPLPAAEFQARLEAGAFTGQSGASGK